ncbi:hypothetical protein Mapa_009512 [Marchantia paleacea]|nr:hypothetical protein Mapa_009512 [Marchantia paleacea]
MRPKDIEDAAHVNIRCPLFCVPNGINRFDWSRMTRDKLPPGRPAWLNICFHDFNLEIASPVLPMFISA